MFFFQYWTFLQHFKEKTFSPDIRLKNVRNYTKNRGEKNRLTLKDTGASWITWKRATLYSNFEQTIFVTSAQNI